MQIEKISRVINVSVNGSSAYDNGLTHRRVLLSLPRVRWLERDEEYVPPQEPVEPGDLIPSYARKNIQPREQEAFDMRKRGMKMVEIADAMGITVKAARGYVLVARRKERYKKMDNRHQEAN